MFIFFTTIMLYGVSTSSAATCDHTKVKKIIKGPVGPGDYEDVCIKSNTVGVKASGGKTTIVANSVIIARTCVEYDSFSPLIVDNDTLDCNTGIWFTYGKQGNYDITNNIYTGNPESY